MIGRFFRLPVADRRLLIRMGLIQVLTALALRTIRLSTLRRILAGLQPLAQRLASGSDERVVWAIETSGRWLRGTSTCLVRALIAELLLGSRERSVRVTIGIRRAADGGLQGHAWAERDGCCLVGGLTSSLYLPMFSWQNLARERGKVISGDQPT
jgi:hypothetical protein